MLKKLGIVLVAFIIVGAIFGGSNNDEDAAESGNIATVLRPVENPAEGIRQFVFNVAYEEREGRFWYDGEDLDEGFNVRKSPKK